MNNQINILRNNFTKIETVLGELYLTKYQNLNSSNTNLNDFKSNYFPQLTEFQKKIAQKNKILNSQVQNWYALVTNDLQIIYGNNDNFFLIKDKKLYVVKPEEFLLSDKQIIPPTPNLQFPNLSLDDFIEINSFNEFNIKENLVKELKNHEVTLNGKNYYLIEHNFKSNLKDDLNEFYGKNEQLEEIVDTINYESTFSYGCLINVENLNYEIVFNRLFADYNFDSTKLIITPYGQVISNEIKKIKGELPNKEVKKQVEESLPPAPINIPRRRDPPRPFNDSFGGGLMRYAAVYKKK